MSWTDEQKKQILDSYWVSKSANCPIDGAFLTVQPQGMLGRSNEMLLIRCPRCMEYFSSDDIQPPVKAFDDYTVNEKIDVANTYFAKEIPICPKDQTSLEISYQEHSGGRAMGVRCPRCGRIYQWDNHLDSINRSRKVNE